jgi:hypothetical protein
MRWIPIALTGMHGLIHLMGFAKGFGYADLPQFTQPISRARGLVWLSPASARVPHWGQFLSATAFRH